MVPSWIAILAFVIGYVVGGVGIGAILYKKHVNIGYIQIWDDDPDEKPYLFLDMNVDISDMEKLDGKEVTAVVQRRTRHISKHY